MLENLHVKDLALIEEAEVCFKDGFNVLTGETGAGKSIVLGSINLALGAKASADVIRTGKDAALIELNFKVGPKEIAKIREMDLSVEDDGEVLLQRKIMQGKTVCRMNGETIGVSQLKELSGVLLNMYGQHEHQTLLKQSTYEKMLDQYAGEEVADYLVNIKSDLASYRELLARRENENTDEATRNRQIELLEFEINEIEEAALKEGEDEELEKRYRFLMNARKIMEAVSETHAVTGYDSDASSGSLIGRGVSRLKSIEVFDDEAAELANQLGEIEDLLNDFNRALTGYEKKLEFDESEFNDVETRLNLVNKMKDKYGRGSLEGVFEALNVKSEELCKLKDFESYLAALDNDIQKLHAGLLAKCAAVSMLRKKAAGPLQEKLTDALNSLNFLDVKFEVNITSSEEHISERGYDNVEFLISLNPGEELRPMQNVASGGELSRIMLAFKSIFADKDDVPTLIFDEIDAGISGVTAYKVAEKMGELSKDHQLICITHLPQIASRADAHFLIEKSVHDGRTVTSINSLEEEASVAELARMLGSDVISESALANARDLKRQAGK